MEAYLLEMPEVIPWGSEFGAVFYKLCLSIMASYLFYFIVVHLKSQSDKENINAFVASKSFRVVGEYQSQIKAIQKEANANSDTDYPEKSDIENMFKAINPKSDAPLGLGQHGGHANWMQYMSYHNNRTQSLVKKVFVKMPFLDSKLVRLLAEIDDCTHFSVIEATISFQFNNTDLSAWASSFYEYSIKCKELQEYNEKKLSEYKP